MPYDEVRTSGEVVLPDGTRRTVKYATPLNATASGDTAIVAAVVGRKIRVLAYAFHSLLGVAVHLRSATTPISATVNLGATGGHVRPEGLHGWGETVAGQALNVNLSAAVAVGVDVVYIEV